MILITTLFSLLGLIICFYKSKKDLTMVWDGGELIFASMLVVSFFIMEDYFIDLIYIIVLIVSIRAYKVKNELKEILHQAYIYHGEKEFREFIKNDLPEFNDHYNLEKLIKHFKAYGND